MFYSSLALLHWKTALFLWKKSCYICKKRQSYRKTSLNGIKIRWLAYLKCSSMSYKFVNSFEEIVRVLLVINQICCHGGCNTVIKIEDNRWECHYKPHARTVSTLLVVHIILTELCEAQSKLIEASRGNYIFLRKELLLKNQVSNPVNYI